MSDDDSNITNEEINTYIHNHLDDPEAYLHKIAWGLQKQADMSYTLNHDDIAQFGWAGIKSKRKQNHGKRRGLMKAAEIAIKREGTDREIRNFANWAWKRAEGAMKRAINDKSGLEKTPEYINQLRAKIKELQHSTQRQLTVDELVERLNPQISWFEVTRERILDALDGERTWNHREDIERVSNQGDFTEKEKIAGESRQSQQYSEGYKPAWLEDYGNDKYLPQDKY